MIKMAIQITSQDLEVFDLELYPSGVESITIAARALSGSPDIAASVSYIEDR